MDYYEKYNEDYLRHRNQDRWTTNNRRVFKYIDYAKRFDGCFWEGMHSGNGWRWNRRGSDKYKSQRKGRC